MKNPNYHISETFSNIETSKQVLSKKTYEQCRFVSCNFMESDLSGSEYIGCTFESCNLALVKLVNTGFKTVIFDNCKLIGVDFNPCSDFLFNVRFNRCMLDYTSFIRKKMRKTVFKECSLVEANFSECDLSEAIFDTTNLSGTVFAKTNLSKADFTTALYYNIDPNANIIKKAIFSANGLAGLLYKFDIEIE